MSEDALAKALARAKRNRKLLGIQTEMERILELPTQDFSEASDIVDKWWALLRRDPNGRPPRQVQAEILEVCAWAAAQSDPIGMVGNVAVGMGKTLAFLLMAEVFDAERSVLLLPPSVRKQFEDDLWEWTLEYKFRKPHVLTYHELSQPEGTAVLRQLNPDLIMADEAQNLRHATAARTKRFLRYMDQNPQTRFVAMSGTLTGSALSDYAHLCKLALRQYCPLPRDERTLKLWGSVLNAEGEPDEQAWQSLAPLNEGAARLGLNAKSVSSERQAQGAMRQAYQKRFASCPGVVTTDRSSCSAKLVLKAAKPKLSDDVRQAMTALRDEFMLPNGDEVVDALHFHRALGQLSCGFYYVWDWPDDIEDEEWLTARRAWWSACRWYLTRFSREGCDSPFLVEEHVRETKRPPALWEALQAWDAQRHKDPPPTRPVWIDYGPVTEAIRWASERDRGIVWYQSRAVGDLLHDFGLPVYGAGSDAPEPDVPKAALSISVFHKGHNMQAWDDQLIMEPMPNAATWEQLLGRMHRAGQTSDMVTAHINCHTWALRDRLDRADNRAKYIQDVTGQPQKLLEAERYGF